MSLAHLTPVDAWSFAAAATAAAFLVLRSHMLRPEFRSLTDAPPWVWLSLSALSIASAGYALTILGGQHTTAREAVLLTVLAVVAVVLFLNLRRQAKATAHLVDAPP